MSTDLEAQMVIFHFILHKPSYYENITIEFKYKLYWKNYAAIL